ncbi:hypothetical protein KY308_02655 [Candidatus Woesearchaeota archaeon]|nr:hypothetical protein [Candidatus Woesearchaeota archaeon]
MEQAPIFIKIDQYKNVLDIIELLKAKVKEAKNQLGKIQQLKSEEDAELDEWSAELEEINKRIDGIDKSLLRV